MEFRRSEALSLGLELELQIVDPATGRLSPSAPALWERLGGTPFASRFALEATQSTLEVNSGVHRCCADLEAELRELVGGLRHIARDLHLDIRGGGTQLTQFWNERIVTPSPRAVELAGRYGFLPKRFSTYGMHVHVGMPGPREALRVANVLQACVPLFIAMSAASPFLQLADTGFAACRPLEPLVYPHGGPMPRLNDWSELEALLQAYQATGLAQSLKDLYWDVRPKPEFGTVEVRVFDTPLSLSKAVALAAFTRAVAAWALEGRIGLDGPTPCEVAARVSRFVACRDGLEARLYSPLEAQWLPAREWLGRWLTRLQAGPPLPEDASTLAGLARLAEAEEEHAAMRRSWAQAVAEAGADPASVEVLQRHSAQMCGRLLAV